MPYTIVGKCTNTSAIIWVSGYPDYDHVNIKCWQPLASNQKKRIAECSVSLTKDIDRIGIVTFSRLEPKSRYVYEANFRSKNNKKLTGSFRTFGYDNFSFLLLSCNVSVASLSRLVGLAASGVGMFGNSLLLERPQDMHDANRSSRATKYSAPLTILALQILQALKRTTSGSIGWVAKISSWATLGLTHGKLGLENVSEIDINNTSRSSPISEILAPKNKKIITDEKNPGTPSDTTKAVSLIDSPFRYLSELIAQKGGRPDSFETPLFAIHAGDQIYADFPQILPKSPEEADYNAVYRETWHEDPFASQFLSSQSNFMILDDHDIWDSYGHLPLNALPNIDSKLWHQKIPDGAISSYRKYTHSRVTGALPNKNRFTPPLYYTFNQGNYGFFVLDTRTERSPKSQRMISINQEQSLYSWLEEDHELKFIITASPFLVELDHRIREKASNGTWSGNCYRKQRNRIFAKLHRFGKKTPIVFLTGDLHCCYHVRASISRSGIEPAYNGTIVHELSAGPIYQFQYREKKDIAPLHRRSIPNESDDMDNSDRNEKNSLEILTELKDFFSNGNAVMQISIMKRTSGRGHTLGWRIITTTEKDYSPAQVSGQEEPNKTPINLSGRIPLTPEKQHGD